MGKESESFLHYILANFHTMGDYILFTQVRAPEGSHCLHSLIDPALLPTYPSDPHGPSNYSTNSPVLLPPVLLQAEAHNVFNHDMMFMGHPIDSLAENLSRFSKVGWGGASFRSIIDICTQMYSMAARQLYGRGGRPLH